MGMHVCIAYPQKPDQTETYLNDHTTRIPGVQTVLSDGFFPERINDQPLFSVALRYVNRFGRAFRPVRSWITMRRVKKLAGVMRKRKIDVVLAEYGPVAGGIFPACNAAEVPLVAHFHGQDAFHIPTIEKYRATYQEMFKTVAGVVVGTDEMHEQLRSLGAPQDRIYKNPCGVDVDLFQPIDPGENPPVFVSLGRFVEKKAPHLTLVAFSRVAKRNPDARLLMIGGGPLLEACKQLAQALKISDRVEFTGVLEQHEIPRIFQRARAFVQHSAQPESGDSEGTSISVLEAAASGLPVVSTRHGGIKASVLHGTTGFLGDEYDIDAMSSNMERLASNPALATQLGQAGRRRMEEFYALEFSLNNLHSILLDVVAKRSSRHG